MSRDGKEKVATEDGEVRKPMSAWRRNAGVSRSKEMADKYICRDTGSILWAPKSILEYMFWPWLMMVDAKAADKPSRNTRKFCPARPAACISSALVRVTPPTMGSMLNRIENGGACFKNTTSKPIVMTGAKLRIVLIRLTLTLAMEAYLSSSFVKKATLNGTTIRN